MGQINITNSFMVAQVGFSHQMSSPRQGDGGHKGGGHGEKDTEQMMTETIDALREGCRMLCQLTARDFN